MPSDEHEDIVSAINSICNNNLRKLYPQDPPEGLYLIVEAFLAHPLLGLGDANKGPRADSYIYYDDGAGPIVVEVGDMKSGKWKNYVWKDKKPIRILRIGFDRFVGILNPRFTQFEKDLLECLQQYLPLA